MPCTRHASLGTILLLAGLAACENGSDPTPLADQPKISAASTKASTLRHFITFKGAIPERFDARVQALGGKVALKENVLRFASVTGLSDQDAQSLVTDGLAATADEEPIIQ